MFCQKQVGDLVACELRKPGLFALFDIAKIFAQRTRRLVGLAVHRRMGHIASRQVP